MQALNDFRDWMDPYLAEYLEQQFNEFSTIHASSDIAQFTDHAKQILLGGKRIRPFICALGLSAKSNVQREQFVSIFIGIELFHAFCLIHDDIIDRTSQRRGVVTMHNFIRQHESFFDPRNNRRDHVADGNAILIGDLILTWACKELFINGSMAQAETSSMMTDVVAGQMLDVHSTLQESVSEDFIHRKMRYKTAGYTFERPFRIGLALAGFDQRFIDQNSNFTVPLGIGFQIQDDYLDIVGDPNVTGKPALSDVKEGQHTFFSQAILAHADDALRSEFSALFGNMDASETQLLALRERILETDILQSGIDAFTAQLQEAKRLISQTSLTESLKETLLHFVEKIESRRS